MKTIRMSISTIAIIAITLAISQMTGSPAKATQAQRREVVVLIGTETGTGGARPYIYSCSKGVPPNVDPSAELGEVLAGLLSAGFEIQHTENLIYTLVR